jgi:disulfide bond formation protein DsbB
MSDHIRGSRHEPGVAHIVRRQRMRLVIFRLWIVAALFPACYFAEHYLLLVWHYGFWRVHKEGLHFTFLPSSHSVEDFVVSNGDHITKTDGFMALPMAIIVWAVLIVPGYFLVLRWFGIRKEANNTQPISGAIRR